MKGVSIIICSYNGAQRLPQTLLHIKALNAYFPWELIVVNNASTDNTIEVVHTELQGHNIMYELVDEPRPGLSHARWCGILNAQYDYLLFCDDDNHLSTNYLDVGFRVLEEHSDVGVVGGLGVPIFEIDKPDWFDEFSHSYAVGPQSPQAGYVPVGRSLYGAACFFRREALLALKDAGFLSILSDRKGNMLSSGGDTELCIALQLIGFRLWYEPELRFAHFIEQHRLTWGYYLSLKQGITSSFPLLEAYRYREFRSEQAFRLHLLGLYLKALKGFIKSSYVYLVYRSKRTEVQKTITKTKLRVFRANAPNAVKAYTVLKKKIRLSHEENISVYC